MQKPSNRLIAVVGVLAASVLYQSTPRFEWTGKETTVYRDVAGVNTVCVGHTGSDVKPGKKYTYAQCMDLFDKDMTLHAKKAIQVAPWIAGNPYFMIAAADFTFHFGPSKWAASEAKQAGDRGDYASMCRLFSVSASGNPLWSYAKSSKSGKKVFMQGLNYRAKWRTEQCKHGL